MAAVPRPVRAVVFLGLAALVACTPSLNWRTVQVPQAWLEVPLPCRAQSAVRTVQWDGHAVELSVTGCEVSGVLFAVSHAELDDPSRIGPTLDQWQRSVREHVDAPVQEQASPFVPPLALDVPASRRLRLQGHRSDGAPVAVEAVWFARLQPPQARLYQVMVYGPQVDAAVADTLFAGITLLP